MHFLLMLLYKGHFPNIFRRSTDHFKIEYLFTTMKKNLGTLERKKQIISQYKFFL